jgi:energy-coupling factor transport system permease protein
MAVGGIAIAGRRIQRTRYRPDPWRWPETLTAATGVLSAGMVMATAQTALTIPLTWPTLPVFAVLAILLAAVPAAVTPPPPVMWSRS